MFDGINLVGGVGNSPFHSCDVDNKKLLLSRGSEHVGSAHSTALIFDFCIHGNGCYQF